MATLTERLSGPNFLISEGNATVSREEVVIAPGTAVRSGQNAARRDSDGTYITWNPTGTPPGGGTIKGIFQDNYGSTGTGTPTVRGATIARQAEVNADEIDWNGATDAQKAAGTTQLINLGIIPREGL